MKQSNLLEILQILSKYIEHEDEDKLSCDSDAIYMSPGHTNIDEKDREQIEALGAMWSEDEDCWMVFY